MDSLTIRLPKRKPGGNCLVELYRWAGGKIEAAPTAETSIAAADLAPGAKLDPSRLQEFFLDRKGVAVEFETIGTDLFAAVFNGDVATVWNAAAKEDLRVYLAVEDDELSRLPWELMVDEQSLPVFLRSEPRFLRCSRHELPAQGEAARWPVRVLVVVGCTGEQAEELGVDQELMAIRTCLRAVDHSFDLELLDARREDCNPSSIRGRIERFGPHILHFIGHATADAKGGAALSLWDRSAASWVSWPARQITLSLSNLKHDLRLAYLNACRTHVQAKEKRPSPVASLAGAFFGARVPAVIAMQADIHGEAANLCAAEFYRRLAAGEALDAALEGGRLRIMERPEFSDRTRGPYTPVLTVQAEPEGVLCYRRKVEEDARRDSIESCDTLKPVRRLFIDQAPLRRDLLATFFAAPPGKERSAAVFRGSQDAGKSWLAKWLLAACAFQDYAVRYVEARHHANWLEMMRFVVSKSQDGHYVQQPLPPKAQDYFYWTLNHVALGAPVPPGEPPLRVADEGCKLTQAISGDNEAVTKIMQAFLEALRIAAGKGHFLLVADHWHASGDHGTAQVTVQDLKANLWDQIAKDHQSPVKLLLILPPAELLAQQAAADEYPEAHWKRVNFTAIPGSEVPDLLLELYRLNYGEEPSAREREALLLIQTPSLPKELDDSCKFVRKRIGGRP